MLVEVYDEVSLNLICDNNEIMDTDTLIFLHVTYASGKHVRYSYLLPEHFELSVSGSSNLKATLVALTFFHAYSGPLANHRSRCDSESLLELVC